jgi:site-specific recombinase XerD
VTVERYRARLQRFIDEMEDCPSSEISSEKLVLYKRHLMDAGLGAVTIGGFLSCLRGFLRYLRDVQGMPRGSRDSTFRIERSSTLQRKGSPREEQGCGLICGLKLAKVDARTAP